MVSKDALRGYVLEEVVARMLHACGYRVLNDAADDRSALRNGRHGLLVRGRGADHQADALGELALPTPFSLPVRLFAEAKFRKDRTGLADVRNALGVLNDVNERYRNEEALRRSLPIKRYLYRYSLFSASGFTGPAQSFALAQQISLIDLRGPAFTDILAATEEATDAIYEIANAHGVVAGFPTGQVRTALRLALGTWYRNAPIGELTRRVSSARSRLDALTAQDVMVGREQSLLPREELAFVAAKLDEDLTDVFVLAFPDAPFIIALRPDDIDRFNSFLDLGGGVRNIHIGFDAVDGPKVGEWVISAAEDPETPLAYFGLPPLLEAWLLAEGGAESERALRIKQEQLSTITVYRGPRATQLRFVTLARRSRRVAQLSDDLGTPLRLENRTLAPARRRTRDADDSLDPPPDIIEVYSGAAPAPPWSQRALRSLLRLLDEQRPIQAEVIRATARNNGVLSRTALYEIARYPEGRSLRGFTRPIHRLQKQLADEGLVSMEALAPLAPYPRQGRAIWFTMPPEVVEKLSGL